MNKKSTTYILGFMLIVCTVCGTGVSVVHNTTRDMLEKNKRLHRNRIICQAFLINVENKTPQGYENAIARDVRISVQKSGDRERRVYEFIGKGRRAVGFDFSGMGFWDRIDGIIVLTPDLNEIINIRFFDHKETPGLGARIEETWFTDQFKGRKIAWQKSVEERIIVGPSPERDAQNQVDAITGATQTSMALMRFLNQELEMIRGLPPSDAASASVSRGPSGNGAY